jgi:hypothetical protein
MRAVASLALLILVGCTAEEPTTGETSQGVVSSNRIGINRIAINRIAINRIAINRIAINRIAINAIQTHDLLNSPDCSPATEPNCGGRDVLEYLIGCAFDPTVTLVGTSDAGVTYEFHGMIGLAPKWEDRRLTLKEQRWMSACMLARVNNTGKSLFISLRGPNDALSVTTEESNDFILQEGAFYGNIFAETQEFYACRGADLYNGNFGDVVALRACAQPTAAGDKTLCGMKFAGDCDAFNVSRACERVNGDFYERCHTSASDDTGNGCKNHGGWGNEGIANRFEEVITVYVQEHPVVLP